MKSVSISIFPAWLLLYCLFNFHPIFAQTPKYFAKTPIWENNLNCNGYSISMTNDSTYVISGSTLSPDNLNFRIFLALINKSGNFINFKEFIKPDTATYTMGMAINHPSERILVAGAISDTANTSWQANYILADFNSDVFKEGIASNGLAGYVTQVYAACSASDGGYILAGYSTPTPSIGISGVPWHPYMVKLDSSGNREWERLYTEYGPPWYAWFYDVKPALDGSGYFLAGANTAGASVGDILVMKTDLEGNEIWTSNIDFTTAPDEYLIKEWGMSVLPTSDGGAVVTAAYGDPDPFEGCCSPFISGYKGVFLKLDGAGNVLWNTIRLMESDESDEIISFLPEACLVETTDGDYVAAGHRYPMVGDLDGELVKVSKNGEILWRRTYDADNFDDYFYDMIATPDGGFIACGRSETYLPPWGMIARLYIVKTNCMGLLTEPEAVFTYYPLDNHAIQFINQSQYAYPDSIDGGYYIWDFGDGSAPYICGQGYDPCPSDNPLIHQYALSGEYTVTLTAIVCTDTSIYQTKITTQTVGLPQTTPNLQIEELQIYPNPAQNTLTFEWVSKSTSGDLGVKLLSLTGQLVLQTTLAAGETNKTISVAHLPVGMYLYVAEQSGSVLARGKVAVVR